MEVYRNMKFTKYKYCHICDEITKRTEYTGNDFVVYTVCNGCNELDVVPKNNTARDVNKHFDMVWNSIKHMPNKNNFRLAG